MKCDLPCVVSSLLGRGFRRKFHPVFVGVGCRRRRNQATSLQFLRIWDFRLRVNGMDDQKGNVTAFEAEEIEGRSKIIATQRGRIRTLKEL